MKSVKGAITLMILYDFNDILCISWRFPNSLRNRHVHFLTILRHWCGWHTQIGTTKRAGLLHNCETSAVMGSNHYGGTINNNHKQRLRSWTYIYTTPSTPRSTTIRKFCFSPCYRLPSAPSSSAILNYFLVVATDIWMPSEEWAMPIATCPCHVLTLGCLCPFESPLPANKLGFGRLWSCCSDRKDGVMPLW